MTIRMWDRGNIANGIMYSILELVASPSSEYGDSAHEHKVDDLRVGRARK